MASLTDTNINETYCSLIKTNDNNTVTGLSRLSDGLGNNISLSVNTSNNGVCIHGNISFDTFCNYTFPSDTGQTNKVLTVNNDTIGLGDADDALSKRFTFSSATSTFRSPTSITLNEKGVVTAIDPGTRMMERTYLYYGPNAHNNSCSGIGACVTNGPSFGTIECFLNGTNGLNLKSAVNGKGHEPGDIAHVVFSKTIFNSRHISARSHKPFFAVYKAEAIASEANPSGVCYRTTNFQDAANYPKFVCATTANVGYLVENYDPATSLPLSLNINFS
tara:strand:- start:151 stop:978 length:828 start_codon:yes stop_codon:yes gene_type:complete